MNSITSDEENIYFEADPDLIYEVTDCSTILEPSKTQGGLYLGTSQSARDISLFIDKQINAILDVAGLKNFYPKDVIASSKSLAVQDSPQYDLSAHFQDCFEFIDRERENGVGVLVHCSSGKSRSSAIVIGYLMQTMGMDLEQAFKFVRRKRTCISPNSGFLKQLKRLEKELKEKSQEIKPEEIVTVQAEIAVTNTHQAETKEEEDEEEEENIYFPVDPDLVYENTDYSIILEPSNTHGGLYLGNQRSARDITCFIDNGINAILDVAGLKNFYPKDVIAKSKSLEIQDSPIYDFSVHFKDCFDFIHEQRMQGIGVLVHCAAGISRSSTIVIGYLMSTTGMSLEEAFKFVRKKRTCIAPNSGFLRQLKRLEKEIQEKRDQGMIDKETLH